MATMAAEKIEMTVLKTEEEALGALARLLLEPGFRPESIDGWRRHAPLVDRVYLVDRDGPAPLPVGARRRRRGDAGVTPPRDLAAASGSGAGAGTSRWAITWCWRPCSRTRRASRCSPCSAATRRPSSAMCSPRPWAGSRARASSPCWIAPTARCTPRAPSPMRARSLTVSFGETLPAWRVALYQPDGVSPEGRRPPPDHALHGRLRAAPRRHRPLRSARRIACFGASRRWPASSPISWPTSPTT